MPQIKLKSCDDQIFEVDVKEAECSMTIKTMLENLGISEDSEEEDPVPLPNVNGKILGKVLEWAKHHKDDEPVNEDENSESRKDDISAWDMEFLQVCIHTDVAITLLYFLFYIKI